MMADLANEFAVSAELEKLCGTRPIGGAGGVATREDEDVSLGVHRHACDLAEIDIRREFQKIGNRLVSDLGRVLSEKRNTHDRVDSASCRLSSNSSLFPRAHSAGN